MVFVEISINNSSRKVSIRADKVVAVMDSQDGKGAIVCLEQYDEDSCVTTAESRESIVKRLGDAMGVAFSAKAVIV